MKATRIILIGYMGVGKTTFGKKLAKALDYTFVDADATIEKAFGKTVTDIFAEIGEEGFRMLETQLIESLEDESIVFATGGGMPCFNDNMTRLAQKGITVYLSRPAKELYNRLMNAKAQRPILAHKSDEEMLTFIEQQLALREPFYTQAEITLNRTEQEPTLAIQIIEEYLKA